MADTTIISSTTTRSDNTEQDMELPFHLYIYPSSPTESEADANTPTIILLHGLLSSHLEFALVTPYLQNYHVILVDLPGHGHSCSFSSAYTIPAMADCIANLIPFVSSTSTSTHNRNRHHNRNYNHGAHDRGGHDNGGQEGGVHIVGSSMGGFVGLELARRYPSLCKSVFVTGAAPFQGTFKFLAKHPWVVYTFMWLIEKLPDRIYWWMAKQSGFPHRHEELRQEMARNRRWKVVKEVYSSILKSVRWEEISQISRVRTLNIAAGKQDDVEATRKVGKIWRESGITGNKAVVVKDALHAWDLQKPELFAEGIKAWVEGRELPEEFETLD